MLHPTLLNSSILHPTRSCHMSTGRSNVGESLIPSQSESHWVRWTLGQWKPYISRARDRFEEQSNVLDHNDAITSRRLEKSQKAETTVSVPGVNFLSTSVQSLPKNYQAHVLSSTWPSVLNKPKYYQTTQKALNRNSGIVFIMAQLCFKHTPIVRNQSCLHWFSFKLLICPRNKLTCFNLRQTIARPLTRYFHRQIIDSLVDLFNQIVQCDPRFEQNQPQQTQNDFKSDPSGKGHWLWQETPGTCAARHPLPWPKRNLQDNASQFHVQE